MAKRGRELIQLNGVTAHLGRVGDRLTIMSFARYRPEEAVCHSPRVAVLNDKNEILRYQGDSDSAFKVVAT